MDSLHVATRLAEPSKPNYDICGPTNKDNDNDDHDDHQHDHHGEPAIGMLDANRTGNNGDCGRNEPAVTPSLSDDETVEAAGDEHQHRDEDEVDGNDDHADDDDDDDQENDDHPTVMLGAEQQLAQHGFGLHLDVGGMVVASPSTSSRSSITTTAAISRAPRTTRRPGKVEFVRFDSKETVYLTEPNEERDGGAGGDGDNNSHQHEMVRNKIREEIMR